MNCLDLRKHASVELLGRPDHQGQGRFTYHLFASRWDQAKGHHGWGGSKAVHAVSDRLIGPYVDKGLCWPDNLEGKGHNVTALVLPDGRYAVVVSETRPGEVFVSSSLDGFSLGIGGQNHGGRWAVRQTRADVQHEP